MFYIEKYVKFNKRHFVPAHMGPAIVVFLAFFGITLWNWMETKNTLERDKAAVLVRTTEETGKNIQEQFKSYEDIMGASAGLFMASDAVTQDEWKQFIDSFNLNSSYPGISSIGFIQMNNADTNVAFAESLNSEQQQIADKPGKEQQEAMEVARDSGKAVLSGLISFPPDSKTNEKQQGFILYMPVYSKFTEVNNPQQRQQAIIGYVYAQLEARNLIANMVRNSSPHFAFQVLNGGSDAQTIYQTDNFERISQTEGRLGTAQTIGLANTNWQMESLISPDVISSRDQNRPAATLGGGLLLSLFLASFIYMLLANRTSALAEKEKKEIAYAKDELLALASHQLRTPATGVKQYIGMLREGYGGRISSNQRKLLDKAYSSNERQLRTINDMLFVARADAGNIDYNMQRFNLSSLVKDILEEHTDIIKSRKQRLVKQLPDSSIFINGDERFIRMAIENILSNATKYTPEKGKITVRLQKKKSSVEVSISDTGVGVDEKDYPMLFQKFSRIPNELTNQVSGSGIGLYLAKKVVEAHKGTIGFESKAREGSSCILKLPVLSRKNPTKV